MAQDLAFGAALTLSLIHISAPALLDREELQPYYDPAAGLLYCPDAAAAAESAPRFAAVSYTHLHNTMIESIRKRSGDIVPFEPEKITWAIFKAAAAVGGDDWQRAEELSRQVVEMATSRTGVLDVEEVQDMVEKVLIENRHARTAKAYILSLIHI